MKIELTKKSRAFIHKEVDALLDKYIEYEGKYMSTSDFCNIRDEVGFTIAVMPGHVGEAVRRIVSGDDPDSLKAQKTSYLNGPPERN